MPIGILKRTNKIRQWTLICITVLLFCINICVNSLNMFIKKDSKLEMFVVVLRSYVSLYIPIVKNTVPLVD